MIDQATFDKMSAEINNASVSVWRENLEEADEGIKLDDLWPILDKYLKQKQDGTEAVCNND